MSTTTSLLVALMAASTVGPVTAAAQSQGSRTNSPARPSPAHERLAVFEGTWLAEATDPESASRDVCAWLPGGRRHMICRRVAESDARAREQMTIYSYRRADSTYVVTALLPGGQVWNYSGRPEGNRWVFYLDSPRIDDTLRLRQVVIAGTDTLHFVEEVSANGGQWRLTDPSEDYRFVRAGNPPPRAGSE